jgi:hypothetical protein
MGFLCGNYGVVSFPVCVCCFMLILTEVLELLSSYLISILLVSFTLSRWFSSSFWAFILVLRSSRVYIVLLPALGYIRVIATNSRKFYRAMIMSIIAIAFFIYNCLGTPYVYLGNESISSSVLFTTLLMRYLQR